MPAPILSQRDLDFMLYELLNVEALTERERYADHSKETFDAAMETARTVAEKYFIPIRRKVDSQQPTFDGEKVNLPGEIKVALDAIQESGLAAATADYELGGMQLPMAVANSWIAKLGRDSCSGSNCDQRSPPGSRIGSRWEI